MDEKHKYLDGEVSCQVGQYQRILKHMPAWPLRTGSGLWSQIKTETACASDRLSKCASLIVDVHFHCWGCDPELLFHG